MKRFTSLRLLALRGLFLLCSVCAGNAASASASCTNAAQSDSTYIVGRVYDGATRQPLQGARAELLTAGGRLLAAMRIGDVDKAMGIERPWQFAVPDKKADYRIRLSKAGYDTLCLFLHFAPERQTTLYYYGATQLWRSGTAEADRAPHAVEAGPFLLSSLPHIYGQVRDAVTDKVMTGVAVDLLTPDSLRLWTMYSGGQGQYGSTPKAWAFGVPKQEARYIVRFRAEGYEPVYQDVAFKPLGRKTIFDYGTTYLH